MSVRAGTLRHRVRIDRKTETPSGTGGVVVSWNPFKTVSAEMRPLSGREYMVAEQTSSKILVRAKVRARSGIEPNMRLCYRGLIYNIDAVLPDPESWNEYEVLMLSEGLNDG